MINGLWISLGVSSGLSIKPYSESWVRQVPSEMVQFWPVALVEQILASCKAYKALCSRQFQDSSTAASLTRPTDCGTDSLAASDRVLMVSFASHLGLDICRNMYLLVIINEGLSSEAEP